MMEVEDISEAFWRETPWGRAMRDQLKTNPFPRYTMSVIFTP